MNKENNDLNTNNTNGRITQKKFKQGYTELVLSEVEGMDRIKENPDYPVHPC